MRKTDETDEKSFDAQGKDSRKDSDAKVNGQKSGRRRRKKGSDREGDGESREHGKYRGIDMSWYTKYPILSATTASIPFPNLPGRTVAIGHFDAQSEKRDLGYTIPGTIAIEWMPFVYSTGPNSAINQVGREIYSRVREVYSGNLYADPPDFVTYIECLDTIYAGIAQLKKIYRTSTCWMEQNIAAPATILGAMNISTQVVENIRSNREQMCNQINQMIMQLVHYSVPDIFDVFHRHYWLNDNIFTDSAEMRSQFYTFYMSNGFAYQMQPMGTTSDLASGAIVAAFPTGSNVTFEQMILFVQDKINRLAQWDTALTIAGYLRRAFPDTPYFTVSHLELYEEQLIVYDELTLMQIENARALPYPVAQNIINGAKLAQDAAGTMILSSQSTYRYQVDENVEAYGLPPFYVHPSLSIRSDAPSTLEVINASRLLSNATVNIEGATGSQYASGSITAGTEVVLSLILCTDAVNGVGARLEPNIMLRPVDQAGYVGKQLQIMHGLTNGALINLLNLAAFDWHPQCWVGYTTEVASNPELSTGIIYPMFDVHNITTLSDEQLNRIHDVCMLSEYAAYSVFTTLAR